MSGNYKSLIDARNQWERDIKMYQEFLKGDTKTFEGRYGAEEYITMAQNRLNDINLKLKAIKQDKFNN